MKIRPRQLILFLAFFLFGCSRISEIKNIDIAGVKNPVISLNGTWKFSMELPKDFWETKDSLPSWSDIQVPGECQMQGFAVRHDQPFFYTREFNIPSDFKGKLVKLRFEGVYSYARVWVNGVFIRDHSGGFTAWECDITSTVKPGEKAAVLVEVTDKQDDISYASGYAKHQIGGILRNVSLLALPENYPEHISISTDFDDRYMDATLTIEGTTRKEGGKNTIELELYDSKNRKLPLGSPSAAISGTNFKILNLIVNPLKWDAEHPQLYRLRISFTEDGKTTWQKNYQVGFREIVVSGNQLLINGKPVKLRGFCRHDMHPLLGRISTPDYDLKDVLLAKEANANFIRTSHYPPTETFLNLCDQYGIYVEDETAVCFVGTWRLPDYQPCSSENSPDFSGQYLSQIKEMADNHRNHASVIIWSIGNESYFGDNFKRSYDWIKASDPTRPVIFSYPGQVPDSVKCYDILSMHYPTLNGSINDQFGINIDFFEYKRIPVLFDEWAHVPCYNRSTVKEDPNVRDFWGITIDTMWQKLFDSDGGLGGAIWGMVDETFMMPADLPGYNEWWGKMDKNVLAGVFSGHTIGYGEWGIVDTWRRKKPEFWSVKKAYSPVRIPITAGYEFTEGKPLEIQVYNRFDFTNINELNTKLTVGGITKKLNSPDIPPHSKGAMLVDLEEWPAGEALLIEFFDQIDNLIDSYALSRKSAQINADHNPEGGNIELSDNGKEYIISCENNLKINIDKSTGLFSGIETSAGKKQFSGPFINLRVLGKEVVFGMLEIKDLCKDWKLGSFSVKKENNSVVLSVRGTYSGNTGADFIIHVFPDGNIISEYSINNFPEIIVREAGIKFVCENAFDTLTWKRIPYWSTYPEGHLSRAEGKVPLYTPDNKSYREAPGKDWEFDKKSFFYNGIENETSDELINIARSAKENILEYNLVVKGGSNITVYGKGDGGVSCRIEKIRNKIILYINRLVDYPDLGWGCYTRNIKIQKIYTGRAQIGIFRSNDDFQK